MISVLGKKVLIVGDHPHSGETGTADEIKNTLAGPGLLIKLDNCPHGASGCFIFWSKNLKVLK